MADSDQPRPKTEQPFKATEELTSSNEQPQQPAEATATATFEHPPLQPPLSDVTGVKNNVGAKAKAVNNPQTIRWGFFSFISILVGVIAISWRFRSTQFFSEQIDLSFVFHVSESWDVEHCCGFNELHPHP